jgi:hypothetical protein
MGSFGEEVIDRLLIRLEDLPFPTRVRGCLGKLGLERVGDLIELSPEALTRQKNFGSRSLRVVSGILARIGLRLGMAVEGWPPTDAATLSRERYGPIGEELRRVFITREGGTLEEELWQLASPAGSKRNMSIAVRHLGWDGLGGRSLEAVARERRISRQYAFEIVKRVRSQYEHVQVQPPRLRRCLLAARPRFAERAGTIEERLYRMGETASRFRIEGILTAAAVFNLPPPIELFPSGRERLVARIGEGERVRSILQRARGAVGRRGAASLRGVFNSVSGRPAAGDVLKLLLLDPRFEWLDDSRTWFWFRPEFGAAPRKTENRLVNRIASILGARGSIHIAEIENRFSRPLPTGGPALPRTVLLGICQQTPWCTVGHGTITRLEHLDWSGVGEEGTGRRRRRSRCTIHRATRYSNADPAVRRSGSRYPKLVKETP